MNCCVSIFYQTLILLASYRLGFGQEFEYHLELQEVSIDGILNADGTQDKIWESVFISKYKYADTFVFQNGELHLICYGRFSSADIEIVELFGRVLRFSLVREAYQLWINLFFTLPSSVLLFFADVRKQQRKQCGKSFTVEKFFQYQILEEPSNVERLQVLSCPASIYLKNIDSYSDVRPKTVHFTVYKEKTPSEHILLILQSKTYNISEEVGANVYILCAFDIVTHRFILRFSSVRTAKNFLLNSSVLDDLNPEMPCPTDWVTTKIFSAVINWPEPPEDY